MTDREDNFEAVPPGAVLRQFHGGELVAQRVDFEADDLPPSLRQLAPLARKWGVGDRVVRDALLRKASPADLSELKKAVEAARADLDAWLTSAVTAAGSSSAFRAFACLRLAADSVL